LRATGWRALPYHRRGGATSWHRSGTRVLRVLSGTGPPRAGCAGVLRTAASCLQPGRPGFRVAVGAAGSGVGFAGGPERRSYKQHYVALGCNGCMADPLGCDGLSLLRVGGHRLRVLHHLLRERRDPRQQPQRRRVQGAGTPLCAHTPCGPHSERASAQATDPPNRATTRPQRRRVHG
jgi:hypothetical protein